MNLLADTHAALWFLWAPEELSASADSALAEAVERGERVGLSSISLCEVVYLSERGRIRPDALSLLMEALQAPEAPFQELTVDAAVAVAMRTEPCTRIPDMPDRIIAACAVAHGLQLVTKDRVIRESGVPVIW